MPAHMMFADVLEAASHLSLPEQESLLQILRHRILERRRDDLAAEVRDARAEFREGKAAPPSVEEIMTEATSGGLTGSEIVARGLTGGWANLGIEDSSTWVETRRQERRRNTAW